MNKAWKEVERKVAKLFGTKRTPLSGRNSSITGADIIHPYLFVEVKHHSQLAIWEWFSYVEKRAKKEGKLPLLVLKKKRKRGFLFVARPQDWDKIAEAIRRGKTFDNGGKTL